VDNTFESDQNETRLSDSAVFVADEQHWMVGYQNRNEFLGNICSLKIRPVRVNTCSFNSMISRD